MKLKRAKAVQVLVNRWKRQNDKARKRLLRVRRRALQGRRLARQTMLIQASAQPFSDSRHLEDIVKSFAGISGEEVDIDLHPDAWCLLSTWDEHWLQLTCPASFIKPAWLLIMTVELGQIISLLMACQAITHAAARRSKEALDAVVQSRIYEILRTQGDNALTVQILTPLDYDPLGIESKLIH